jgi:hypothetical protein
MKDKFFFVGRVIAQSVNIRPLNREADFSIWLGHVGFVMGKIA